MGKSIARPPSPHPFADDDICCWPGCEAPRHIEVPICGEHLADAWLVGDRCIAEALRLPDRPTPVPDPVDPLVYYVQIAPDVIKIGTTINLPRRLKDFRLDPDAVLATEPGGRPLEKMRHAQFEHLRIGRRENFRAEPDLLSHVEMLRAHVPC